MAFAVFLVPLSVPKISSKDILNHQLLKKDDSFLLAISGGADSVVLAHLLSAGNYKFSLAHCNFKLRGNESEKDEQFCEKLAKKLNVKFYSKQFDVLKYQKEKKVSVQMAARDLRYDWFDEILQKEKIDYILTAHHANDVIETVFLNLLRGTGLNGIKGIPEKNGKILRPLLKIKKQDILRYATKNKLKFRLDKSNLNDKYERNYIRIKIIPLLKKLNPSFEDTMLKNISRFGEENKMLNEFYESKRKNLVLSEGDTLKINKKPFENSDGNFSLMSYLIKPYGFNNSQAEDVLENILLKRSTGKKLHAKNYDLAIDKDFISIKKSETRREDFILDSVDKLKSLPFLKINFPDKFTVPKKNELTLETNKLIFPIQIRQKKTGDKFKPFGMKGFKLLSDFLKDEKLSTFDREKVKLLVNGNNEIIWVIGYRSDERYRINEKHKELLKLTFIE